MREKKLNLTRRKFIAASSAAVAAPFVMSMAGKITEAKAAEKKTFFINDNCILCPPLRCKMACPNEAIWFDGDKLAIDNEKCAHCGKCMEVCNLSAIVDANAPPPVHKPHDIIRRSCDFLVLGGGTAGLIAAAKFADELSGKKVIVLEKAKKPGGSGYYPAGYRLFSTKWQLNAGVPDQMDDYIRSAMNITRWELNPQLVANSFRALPAFFDWFCTWGKPEEIFTMIDSRYSKSRKNIEIKNFDTERCTKVMLRLIEKCTELGVEILTEYAATGFIMGDRGEITGVIAKDPGGKTIFNCKFCLVATGNVINCSPLMQRCVPEYAQALKRRTGHCLPTNTGDGVLMAEKAGIPIDYDSVCVAFTALNSSLAEPEQLMAQEQRGEALYVNLNGKRWVNETFTAGDFNWILLKQPKCMFYSIMDSKIVSVEALPMVRILTEGNEGGRNVEAGVPDPNEKETGNLTPYPGRPRAKTNLKELQRIASLPGRHVVIADTIEELADKMGIDRKTFVATVKRYNELCAKGHDDDYFKPAKYLLPIEKGPFYAFNHFLGHDGAVGGLAVNENMQVMGHNGPVKGLYAAGDTTGSRFINRGGERIEIINDNSWAAASGFLAGQNIGKQLKTS